MSAQIETTGTIAKGAYVNEWVSLGSGQWVHKYAILGTTVVCYEAYEPYAHGFDADGHYYRSHSTITSRDDVAEGGWLGDVTTRDLPPEIEALPGGSDERVRAVRAWYDANRAVARQMILAAFPQDF